MLFKDFFISKKKKKLQIFYLQVISLLTLSSQVHNEVRVVKVCSSFIVSNSSSIPLQVTALAVRHSDMNCRLTIPMANSLEAIDATIDVLPDSKHRYYIIYFRLKTYIFLY